MIASTVLWLALNMYHESRGEPDKAQIAVAHVVLNRSRQTGQTVQEVVTEEYQFSWRLTRSKRNAQPWKDDPEVFLECSLNAVRALAGQDFTKGATYFHEKRIKPRWAKKMQQTGRYGKLIFLKERRK